MKQALLATAIFALVATLIQAECPNGCSGAGTCSSKDMCNCFKNYQGNDCSLQTCPFGYAHVDTPKGDLDMDGGYDSTWILTNSQVYPAGTFENRNPGAAANEGHYYMECSNRGMCDRDTGDCVCFEGYEGSSCQRTSCPNQCSNHGTCESISELATTAGGTLFFPSETALGDTTYGLWDEKVSYGCRCDPGYYGPDCSLRRCRVGVDPLYESVGTEIVDHMSYTFAVDMQDADTSAPWVAVVTLGDTSYVRLKYFDYYGEAYITERITITGSADAVDSTAIQNALLALPNDVITSVTCERAGAGSVVDGLATYVGTVGLYSVSGVYSMGVCKFTSNPGAHRLPELEESVLYNSASSSVEATTQIAYVGGTRKRGEDSDYCGTLSSSTVAAWTLGSTTVTASAVDTVLDTTSSTVVYLAKFSDQYMAVVDMTGATITTAFEVALATKTGQTESLFYSTTALTVETTTAVAMAVNSKTLTTTGTPSDYAVGSLLFLHNQFLKVISISTTTTTVDRPFYGDFEIDATDGTNVYGKPLAGATDPIYFYATAPTASTYTYVSECSGRGLCDADTGVCQCFKGYSGEACDTQNTMSF